MKKAVKYITIAVMAIYIGGPLAILGANYAQFRGQVNEVWEKVKDVKLENIKTLSITCEDIKDARDLLVSNNIRTIDSWRFDLFHWKIDNIKVEGETLYLTLSKHELLRYSKLWVHDSIYNPDLEHVILNGKEWSEAEIVDKPIEERNYVG